MATNTGRLTKTSIGKESTWGTFATPTIALSAKSNSVINKVQTTEDPRFIGELFTTDLILTGLTAEGNLDLTAHPQEIGPVLNYVLAKNDTPGNAPTCRLMISYTGADVYADLVLNTGTLIGASGATVGTKVAAFTLDFSVAANNTPSKVAALINAQHNWYAYVFGDGSVSSASIVDFALVVIKTGDNIDSQILPVPSASTTSKEHHVYPAGAADSWPSFTMIQEKTYGPGQAVAYTGCKIDQVAMKITAGAIVDLSATITGKLELTQQTYPGANELTALGTGDATTTVFSMTLPYFSSYTNQSIQIYVNGTSQNVTCSNATTEVLTTTPNIGSGTYVRATGVLTFTFSSAPAWGAAITTSYTTTQTVTPATDTPYVAGKARIIFNGIESTTDKDITLTIATGMDKSKVVGQYYIIEQIPTNATVTLSGTANIVIAEWLKKYSDFTAVTAEEVVIYMENSGWADQANNVKNHVLIKIPSLKYDKYDTPITGPNRITTSISGKAIYESGKNRIDCYIVDKNTSAY